MMHKDSDMSATVVTVRCLLNAWLKVNCDGRLKYSMATCICIPLEGICINHNYQVVCTIEGVMFVFKGSKILKHIYFMIQERFNK